jgi:hypothetical protein
VLTNRAVLDRLVSGEIDLRPVTLVPFDCQEVLPGDELSPSGRAVLEALG